MKYLKYLSYLLRHKWFVSLECFKMGLYWRGLLHDLDKFKPSLFIPYARFFFAKGGDISRGRDKTGYYKAFASGDKDFDMALFLHLKHSPHHWQYWVSAVDQKETRVFDIPLVFRKEMLCDWIGAGRAQGFYSPPDDPLRATKNWYKKNAEKMRLHTDTRIYFDLILHE